MIETIWDKSPKFYRRALARVAGIKNPDDDFVSRNFMSEEPQTKLGGTEKGDLRKLEVSLPANLIIALFRILM